MIQALNFAYRYYETIITVKAVCFNRESARMFYELVFMKDVEKDQQLDNLNLSKDGDTCKTEILSNNK